MAQMGGAVNGYRGMPGRGRGAQGRGHHHPAAASRGAFSATLRAAHPAAISPAAVSQHPL
jgi:hypothetical protein